VNVLNADGKGYNNNVKSYNNLKSYNNNLKIMVLVDKQSDILNKA